MAGSSLRVQQHWFNCDSVCLSQSDFALTSMAFPVLNSVGDYFYIRVTTEGKAKPHIRDSVCLLQNNGALTSMAFPVLNNVGDYFSINVTTEGKAKGMRKDEQASVVVHAKNTRMAGRWGRVGTGGIGE